MKYQKHLVWFMAVSIMSAQTRELLPQTTNKAATTVTRDQSEKPPADNSAIVLPGRLFGWADLHAHPAVHLAFGADENGENGIFWGNPGKKWVANYSDTNNDLPACSFKHGDTDGDLIRHETHKALMENLDSVTEYPHQTADFGANNHGATTYAQWPHARSLTHQQMHITQLRRAYDGGQRILVASVTDNEFLSDMWTQIGYNIGGNPVPSINPFFGFTSALRQLEFIKAMAASNPDWMEVAYSGADARRIVKADKLAIILSLEIDSLNEQQVLALVAQGVRHVIPVHLVDSEFGGTAIYGDMFNAMNNFIHSSRDGGNLNNDGFFKIEYDEKFTYRLGRPTYPRPEGFNVLKGGAINIDPVPDFIWLTLGYNFGGSAGHRNSKGLTSTGKDLIKRLAKMGVLLDVAHMSTKSTADTLAAVTPWDYPVMDSHTGFREVDGTAENERALDRGHAKKIADLGGVIGFGTDAPGGFETILDKKDSYLLGFNTQIGGNANDAFWYQHTWTLPTIKNDPEIAHLKLRIVTGEETLGTDLNAIINFNGSDHTYLLNKFHETWRSGLVTTSTISLPAGIKSSKINKITLRINKGGGNWRIKELKIDAVARGNDPVSSWLAAFKEGLSIMGGKAMAVGTDLNGFAPQLWLPADNVTYPITLAHVIGPAAHTPILQKAQFGSKTYDFKKDGIAHYGMLPDFFQAVNEQPGSSGVMNALFHSVDDVVKMWEKCEKSAANVK